MFKPLKVLLATVVTLGRLIEFKVLALALALVVPVGVIDTPLIVVAVMDELALVKVRLPKLELLPVRDELARVKIFPVAVVEVILVVPKPVRAIDPLVPVSDNAPVVRVNPLEAVRV